MNPKRVSGFRGLGFRVKDDMNPKRVSGSYSHIGVHSIRV